MSEVSKDDQKEWVKEAMEEWLEKQFMEFSKWTMRSLMSAAFVGAIYLWLTFNGWHR